MSAKGDRPIFPPIVFYAAGLDREGFERLAAQLEGIGGLTVRAWLTGMALPETLADMLRGMTAGVEPGPSRYAYMARRAVAAADAAIAELNKPAPTKEPG